MLVCVYRVYVRVFFLRVHCLEAWLCWLREEKSLEMRCGAQILAAWRWLRCGASRGGPKYPKTFFKFIQNDLKRLSIEGIHEIQTQILLNLIKS